MPSFTASPFLTALGWALLNGIWQFAICWLVYRTVTTGIKQLTASARHSIALFLLFCGTAAFIGGLSWKYYTEAIVAADNSAAITIANNYYYTIWHTASTTMDTIMPYWSALYLLCIVFLFIKFCLFVHRAGSLQKNGITKMNGTWRMYIKRVSAQLGIKKEVKAMLSVHIDTPQVIGFLKPVILLPAACLNNLTIEQLEAVLLHELVHIKRNDYFVNLFVTSVEILFFFNPFVKQLTGAIRKEREYSCDDMVIQFQYHPHNYATALLTLEKSRLMPVTYGIAAGGKNQQQLLTRIERIMGIENRKIGFYRMGACLMALLLLGFIATINPAKVAADNFGEANFALAFSDINLNGEHLNDEAGKSIQNLAVVEVPKKKVEQQNNDKLIEVSRIIKNENQLVTPVKYVAADDNEDEDEDNAADINIKTASKEEKVDFSLSQKEKVAMPDGGEAASVAEPYIPSTSFSFQLTQDTTTPKLKGLSYNDRMAKDALLKTQKALEQLNWQKIEKQLKYKKLDIAKLKTEIAGQLQKLNWLQINSEVKLELTQEQLNKLQDAVNQDRALKQYQQIEAYQEAMTRQLAEQAQYTNEATQRLRETQKAATQQQKKTETEMKRKRIIYI